MAEVPRVREWAVVSSPRPDWTMAARNALMVGRTGWGLTFAVLLSTVAIECARTIGYPPEGVLDIVAGLALLSVAAGGEFIPEGYGGLAIVAVAVALGAVGEARHTFLHSDVWSGVWGLPGQPEPGTRHPGAVGLMWVPLMGIVAPIRGRVGAGRRWPVLSRRLSRHATHLRDDNRKLRAALAEATRIGEARALTIELFQQINAPHHDSLHDLERRLEATLRQRSGCDAVAIRCRSRAGSTGMGVDGRTAGEVPADDPCASCPSRTDGGTCGTPGTARGCLCDALMCRRVDPSLPWFTPGGGFWTNRFSEVARHSAAHAVPIARGPCYAGYESVAVFPLRVGDETFGLLQFSGRREGQFAPSFVAQFERVVESVGGALGHRLDADALRARESHLRRLIEYSPVAKLIVADGQVIFTNAAADRLFGRRSGDVPFHDLGEVCPEDQGRFDAFCVKTRTDATTRQTAQLRFRVPAPGDGTSTRWVRCETYPIPDPERTVVLISMVDITKLKHLEQFVTIRENLATIGQLTTGLAHEIRSPLTGINLNLSTIDRLCTRTAGLPDAEKEQIGRLVAQAKSASTRIASIIDRVMAFAKPVPPKLAVIDVNQVVMSAADLARASVRQAGVDLQETLWDLGHRQCLADFRLLEQVVLTLATNAIQAMADRAGPKRLELATVGHGRHVLILVADSGPGVPDYLRERIFAPFYTTKETGHGIGLSFSRRVIAGLGGSLSVRTSRWGGAEFRITLPVHQGGANE